MVAVQSKDVVVSRIVLDLLSTVPEIFDFTLQNKVGESAVSLAKRNKGLDHRVLEIVEANSPPEMTYYSTLPIPNQLKFLQGSIEQLINLPTECKEDLLLLVKSLESHVEFFCQGNFQTFGMNSEHRAKLRGCHMFLLRNLELGELVSYLYQEGVISEYEQEEILTGQSRSARVNKLLLLLPTRGPDGFDKFLKGLKLSKQDHVAERLEQWQPSHSFMTEELVGNLSVVPTGQAQLSRLFMEVSKTFSLQKCLTSEQQ